MATTICIGKYPPLEGGIASKAYWFVNAMAMRGHRIHVVADPIDIETRYSLSDVAEIPHHPEITIHRPDSLIPWHIPDDRHRTISLLNKLCEVVESCKPDLIEANYLVPYGIVAYLANQITGVPYVLRHGGSDIRKFLNAGVWDNLWQKTMAGAEITITDADGQKIVRNWSNRTQRLTPYVPDPASFFPERRINNRPVLALIGKANYYWKHKGWHRVIDIWQHLGDDFEFIVISQGIGLDDFKNYVIGKMGNRVTWKPFVAPWQMPALLNSLDGVFCFQANFPFPVFSNLVTEVLYCGSTLFVDRPDIVERFQQHGLYLEYLKKLILPLLGNDPIKAASKIKNHYAERHFSTMLSEPEVYDRYLLSNEQAWLENVPNQ